MPQRHISIQKFQNTDWKASDDQADNGEEDDRAVKLRLFKRCDCERNRCEQQKVASFLKKRV